MDEIIEPIFWGVTVSCRTGGCENEGICIAVLVDASNPSVICGACGEWILTAYEATPA